MSESSSTSQWRHVLQPFLPTRRAWWLILGACVVGVLLFMGLWLGNRADDTSADEDGSAASTADARALAPLPAPLPAAANGDSASGMDTTRRDDAPARLDTHTAPVPVPAAPIDVPSSADNPATAGDAGIAAADTAPRPVSSPPPTYPRAAMRRGEAGDVLLRVHVGSNGRTTSVDLVRSSQSSRLDRAATSAVRRWRFEPALRDGQPVAGELLVPFNFSPSGG